MANLLEKASIVLTPTAHNNGEALCIKPDDGSGDFDFSRNSAATRVNAQGLVENVQILSSNLVQNGDFSEEGAEEVSNGSFSQEGAEEIVNGGFDTDSDWNKGTGWSISGGIANCDGTNSFIFQNLSGTTTNDVFKVTYTISNYVSGNVAVGFGSGLNQPLGTQRNANGTYTEYLTKTSTSIAFGLKSFSFIGSIDNVSVKEVGQDWNLGTGVSIGENKAVFTSTPSGQSVSQNAVASQIPNGTSVKVSFEVLSISSGSFGVYFSGSLVGSLNSVGVATFYFEKGTETSFYIRALGTTTGSITNISVKEVGQNWDILNDVTSFSFNNGIANIQGTANSANNGIKQASISAVIGKTYKISATLRSNDGGLYRFRLLDGSYFDLGNGNSSEFETITSYHTATSTSFTIFATSWYTSGTANFDISNISIIEISSDTNLPRINYEGFSYQDALGSELVVNGGFDSDTAWTKGTTWSIGGGFASATENDGSYLYQTNICEIGKKYKFTFDVTESSGVSQCVSLFNVWYDNTALAVGTYSVIHTVVNTSGIRFRCKIGGTGSFAIDNVSVKEYLGQEPIPNSGCGHFLWEPQSTNTINNSNSDFLAFNMDLVYNDVKSPDGTQNAFKATTTTTGGSQFRPNQTTITPSTFSIFLKYGNNQWYQVINSSTNGFYANIDVQNGVFGTSGADTDNLSVKDYGNGWFRFSGTFTSASTNGSIRVYASSSSSAGWAGVSAPIGSYVYGYGIQVEALDYATSYIPTSGTSVTRNQDVCTNGGSLASINSSEGVLYAEIAKQSEEQFKLISLNNAANNEDNNSVTIGFNNSENSKLYLRVKANGNNVLLSQNILSNKNQFYKIAIKYKSGEVSFFVDGVKILSSTSSFSFSAQLDNLSFDFNGNGVLPFYGKTKALVVYKEALSDEELTELTTI